MGDALDELLRQPGIWRAGERQRETGLAHLATGFPALDAVLPGGGWPLGALTEILHDHAGIGELSLLMPALARLSRRGRWIALIAPPYLPYAPALSGHGVDLSHLLLIHPGSATDALWAVEQTLRSGTCGAVLAWPRRVDGGSLRRLQLAAGAGRTLGLIFRRHADGASPSPAALRLHLEHRDDGIRVRLLKCRGGNSGQELAVVLSGPHHPVADDPPSSPESPDIKRPPPPPPAAAGRAPRSRGGRRRAAQMDLPLIERGDKRFRPS